MPLKDRRILLGVSSSIAAHRALDLASALRKAGSSVRAVMTASAGRLIAPVAFDAITGERTITTLWGSPDAGEMDHLAVTKWADLFVICPASANTLARLAHGLADDALGTFAVAWNKAPLLIAPAMNPEMWRHAAVTANVELLRARGHEFIGPVVGDTACRDHGLGRLAPVEDILAAIKRRFEQSDASRPLSGVRVLVTSGPTREFADDVRCLTNPSTGRMGVALVEALLAQGAEPVLVTGPCDVPLPHGLSHVRRIQTADEMLAAVLEELPGCRAAVFAAAVSDWKPKERLNGKLKKADSADSMTMELVRTPDIAARANSARQPGQVFVGFAAESTNLESYAGEKMERKGFEMVFANPINEAGAGFGSETNRGLLLFKDGRREEVPSASKSEIARRIVEELGRLIGE